MTDADALTAQLIRAGIHPTQARAFAVPLLAAMGRFEMNTPLRRACFIGQTAVESTLFTQLEEDLWYRDPLHIRQEWPIRVQSIADAQALVNNPKALANVVYGGRMGNGPTLPIAQAGQSDGWLYRGRGLIQITGHANYVDMQNRLARPYVDRPDLVGLPADACQTAACFWHEHGCNELADSSAVDRITHTINPAMEARDRRRQFTDDALRAFAAKPVGAPP